MKTARLEIRIDDAVKSRYEAHAAARGNTLSGWLAEAAAEQYDRQATTGLRKIRKSKLNEGELAGAASGDPDFARRDLSGLIGRECHLVRVEWQLSGTVEWGLLDAPPRGNLDGRVVTRGWCGTTNDVARYAEGRVVVVGQSRTHLHLGVLPED